MYLKKKLGCKTRVARSPAEAASHLHLNLRGKEKRKEGKRQAEGPQTRPQAVQEERMGATAFRPPPNLMRVGKSP